jgi:hypothetical protein
MWIERSLSELPPDRAEAFLQTVLPGRAIDLADPHLFVLGIQQVAVTWQDAGGIAAFQPIALFGYRDGRVYDVAMLDVHTIDVRKTMFLAIAHKAQRAGHPRIVVDTPDHRLRAMCDRFGVHAKAA